jgi:hypothetical protein
VWIRGSLLRGLLGFKQLLVHTLLGQLMPPLGRCFSLRLAVASDVQCLLCIDDRARLTRGCEVQQPMAFSGAIAFWLHIETLKNSPMNGVVRVQWPMGCLCPNLEFMRFMGSSARETWRKRSDK